jgi:hypothetical protein
MRERHKVTSLWFHCDLVKLGLSDFGEQYCIEFIGSYFVLVSLFRFAKPRRSIWTL